MDSSSSVHAGTPSELLGHLNQIEAANAPERLYYRGRLDLLRRGPRVAIVGSREASEAGLRQARQLARQLVQHGVTVVSGLARGVDATVHLATIKAGGSTIAVIGTPIDKVYPAEHRDLQELIAREHLLVSQYPQGYPGSRGNFPRRNRTMALLSHATVIIEASDTSGTLSQGWEAIRLGRALFVSEAIASNRRLKWPAQMMSYGAQILVVDHLLSELPPARAAASLQAAF